MNPSGLSEAEVHRDEVVRRTLVCDTPVRTGGTGADAAGRAAGGGRRLTFGARLETAALAGCDQLTVRVRSRSEGTVFVEMLLHGAATTGDGGALRLSSGGREPLAGGAERELRFPAEAFGFSGRDRGWGHVRQLEVIVKREAADEEAGPVAADVGAVYAERRVVPPGPRLTAGGLTRRLQGPAAAPGHVVPARGPVAALDVGLDAPCPHFFAEDGADDVLAGVIMGQMVTLPIRWDSCPDGTQEWTHFLNRHHFLRPLLREYVETGRPECRIFIEEAMCDWIVANPVPLGSNGGAGPAWETLSAAWRLREWIAVWTAAGTAPLLGDPARRLILTSLWEHCRHLMDHRGHPNNWTILEAGALALAGVRLTEFRESAVWLREGLGRLRRAVTRQFLPDGAHCELSPFYHAHCLFVLLEVRRALEGLGVAAPAELDAPLRRAADFLRELARPDSTWPTLNDSGGIAGDYAAVLRLAAEVLGPDHLSPPAGTAAAGESPDARARSFGSAGIAVLRSGSGPAATHVVFRAGSPGGSHSHADALSLDVSIAGVRCLVDPGISTYAPGALTDHYRSAGAHSMILVDGRGPARGGPSYRERPAQAGEMVLERHADGSYSACGVCRDYPDEAGGGPGVAVTRRVTLHQTGDVQVDDAVTGAGLHVVTVCWQFAPGSVGVSRETGEAVFEDGSGARFALSPALPAGLAPEVVPCRGEFEPPCGWVSLSGRDVPAPHLRYTVEAALPLTFSWRLRGLARR